MQLGFFKSKILANSGYYLKNQLNFNNSNDNF